MGPGVLALSPHRLCLASGSPYPDNSIRLWDAAAGRPITALPGHTNTTRSLAFSPNGLRLVSGSLDQTARLWDGMSGQPVATLRGHTDRLSDPIFSPDGRRVATASADRTLRLGRPDLSGAGGPAAREPGVRPGVQPGRHPPGDGLRRQHHPVVGPRHAERSLRAAGTPVLRPRRFFQPGRHAAGQRFRRRDVANLGHGPTEGAGAAAGRPPTSTWPGPDTRSREAGPARHFPAVKPAAGRSVPVRDGGVGRDRARVRACPRLTVSSVHAQ